MNIKSCWACHTGVAFQPLTNGKGEILKTNSICRNPSCPLFTQNLTKLALKKRKSSLSSKRISKHSKPKSRLLQGTLVMLVSAALSYNACIALANSVSMSNTVTYTSTTSTEQKQSTSTSLEKTVVSVGKSESIHDKLTRYALKYDIPRQDLWQLVGCETGYTWDPNIRSKGKLKNGQQENSRGLAQINMDAGHGVTLSQATDPDFSLDFIGKNWSKRHSMWVNCTTKHNL